MTSKSCKLILLGDSGVGKTTLIHNFIAREYRADFKPTLGADLSTKSFNIRGQQVDIQIWDTAGTERFRSMGPAYYRGADACILVFDITSPPSFEHLNIWRTDLIDNIDIENPDIFPLILFGNKSDLAEERQITPEEAEQWIVGKCSQYFEVSAKSGTNIEEGFLAIIELFLRHGRENLVSLTISDTIDPEQTREKSACC